MRIWLRSSLAGLYMWCWPLAAFGATCQDEATITAAVADRDMAIFARYAGEDKVAAFLAAAGAPDRITADVILVIDRGDTVAIVVGYDADHCELWAVPFLLDDIKKIDRLISGTAL